MSTVLTESAPRAAPRPRLPSWWADAAGVLVAVLVVSGPALFTKDGFAPDFTNHLWLVSVQEYAISHHLTPTYFISAPSVGVFYPFFMFYGGTLYAAAGALAVLAGDVVGAYVAVILLSIAAAYGGWLWLARQLGARSWMAHAPAITFVASAYYVTNLYGRGAWPETVATSALPLVLASGSRLLQSERLEPVVAALFVVAVVFFSGSHNATLLLGALVVSVGLALLGLALGRSMLPRSGRRALAVVGLLALGIGVNAWFLLPDVLYASRTLLGSIPSATLAPFFDRPGLLFNPLRAVPMASSSPALYVQAPVWLMAWALVALAVLWSGTRPTLRRAGCAVALLLLALVCAILIAPVWNALPQLVRDVQFPFRLNTYVALCTAGLVLVGVLALESSADRRRRRVLNGALMVTTAVSIGICFWQLWVPYTGQRQISYPNRGEALAGVHLTPRTWYDRVSYNDASQRPVAAHGFLIVKTGVIDSDRMTLTVTPPAGALPFETDISAGPYAAKLGGGLVRVGRTYTGLTVARRRSPGRGPALLSLAPAGGWVIVGRLISISAVLLVLVLVAFSLGRWLGRRRSSL